MNTATYKIVRNGKAWAVEHDGSARGEYVTKEAAFEAIAGVASNAIKDGHEVRIHVPGRDERSALGSE